MRSGERSATPSDANGSLDERLYALQDANFNVTAVADASGNVVERYLFDPYGKRLVLDANWSTDTDGLSDVLFQHGHQGGKYDSVLTNQVLFRHRVYDVEAMRWLQQDPAAEVAHTSTSLQPAPVVEEALRTLKSNLKRHKLISGAFPYQFLKFADGLNATQYLGSQPQRRDPSGLAGPIVVVGGPIVLVGGVCGLPYYIAAMEIYGAKSDKFRHCWVSCMVARQCGTGISVVGGLAKEVGDLIKGGGFQAGMMDVQANADGYEIAGVECSYPGLGMVTRWFRQSCAEGCIAKGY